MKRFLLSFSMVVLCGIAFAQTPQRVSYQAVLRNQTNVLVVNKNIAVRITILQGSATGLTIYKETHQTQTNSNGLFTLEVGGGVVQSGKFDSIDWGNGPYFVKSETDPDGGTNYDITSNVQLLSVFYALHAKTAERVSGTINETDPVFNASLAKGISVTDTIRWNQKLNSYTETDPLFNASLAKAINAADTFKWNHKLSSYTETDPLFNASLAKGISGADTVRWNQKLSSFTETDPLFNASLAKGISGADTIRWNQKLNSYTETDPLFNASLAKAINAADTFKWNHKLSSYTETDPLFNASLAKGISGADTIRWNNKLSSYTETDPLFNASLAKAINAADTFKWNHKLSSYTETDPLFNASLAKGISGSDTVRWNQKLSSFTEQDTMIWKKNGNDISFNTGKVGIGTLPSTYKLEVNGDIAINQIPLGRGSGTGTYNVRLGLDNLSINTTGSSNTAIGTVALMNNTTGSSNTGLGYAALYVIGSGSHNTGIGNGALYGNITGNNNTAIGEAAGRENTGSSNVFLGYNAGYNELGSNKLYIANSATNNPLIYGDFSLGRIGIGVNNPTKTLHVGGSINLTGDIYKNDTLLSFDLSNTNELQSLSIASDTITMSKSGGQVKLPVAVKQVNILQDSLYITYSNSQVMNAGYVGNGSPGSALASVSTDSIGAVKYATAIVYGHISSSGNELLVGKGICYATTAMPTLANNYVITSGNENLFSASITGLSPATTWYARAFVTNAIGTSYGSQITFTTLALTNPALSGGTIYNVSHTSAVASGTITDNGGSVITESGVCWSNAPNPTVANSKSISGTSADTFVAMISGLTPNTTYYARTYATNAQGTSYGNQLTFTTPVLALAGITTNAVSSITHTTATSGGTVLSDSGSSVTIRGICWGTTALPTTANSKSQQNAGVGSFSLPITALSTNTTYYVRAYATNGAGTSYGNQVSFTTPALSLPALTTKAVTGISSNIAGSGGDISTDGGSSITAKGVVWSINTNPTLANSFTNDGTGATSFNSTLTGLTPLTTYYVKAYATNSLGTTYGNQQTFTTTNLVNPGPSVPTIGTKSSSMLTSSTAVSGGYVTSDGGSTITARGLCWSTTSNPTLANSYSTRTGTLGNYEDTLTGLTGCAVVYYVRAYATNSTGTGYGNEVTVTTGVAGILATGDTVSVDFYSAVVSASIIDSGNCPITQKGVCWSNNPGPTTTNDKTTNGPNAASFNASITNLMGNRTYYYRAYATTSVGTFYGPEKTFITKTPPSPYIGQNYAGGIVFYIDSTGQHGLVCAATDQGRYSWGCSGTNIPGTSSAIGTGATNTAAIIAGCNQTNIGAKICDDLVLNGYSDWFLPSYLEAYEMCSKLAVNGIGFSSYYSTNHSTSTQENVYSNRAVYWQVYGKYVSYDQRNKDDSNLYVRAVRAF